MRLAMLSQAQKETFFHLAHNVVVSDGETSTGERLLMEAAWKGGCRAFDGTLGGHGGCPMAKDDLVGNLPTEILMASPAEWGAEERDWNRDALERAQRIRKELFD